MIARSTPNIYEQGSSNVNNAFSVNAPNNITSGTPIDNIDFDNYHNEEETGEDGKEIFIETQISKLLSERITKIVIIIVLIMLFSQPLF